MTIKDELMQRLKYEQQMEEYNNKKQALQNQTNNASQSSLDNSGAYIEGATGNQWADKGLDTASMALASSGNPFGLAAAAGIQLFKGISNYANQDKNANTERSIQAANQSITNNLNDLNERKANMRNTSLQNMNRLASMQNTGNTQQSLSDMIDNALKTRQNYSIGDSYADKAQRGIDTAQAYNQIAQQEQANKNAAIVDTAKNMASTVAGGMAGAASGAGNGMSSAAGDTALNEAGSALGNAASTAGENAAKDVSGEILNYNYDIPENVSNLNDYTSGGINTPVDTQTLQNTPLSSTQNANYEGATGGAAPVIDNVQFPMPDENGVIGDAYTPQGNVSAEEKANIIESIKNNFRQLGLKGKDFIGSAIDKGSDIVDSIKSKGGDVVNNVQDRLTGTDEEAGIIDSIKSRGSDVVNNVKDKAGIINSIKEEVAKRMPVNKLKQGLVDFYEGYQDNSKNGFTKGDVWKQIKGEKPEEVPKAGEDVVEGKAEKNNNKGFMNRLGEVFGTGQRVMANPWTQAGIATLATKMTGGDWADSLNNAYKYGIDKATSNYYNSKLRPGQAPNALENFTRDDFAQNALAEYRGDMARRGYMTMGEYTDILHNTGLLTDDELKDIIGQSGYDANDLVPIDQVKAYISARKAQDDKKYKDDQTTISQGRLGTEQKKAEDQKEHWDAEEEQERQELEFKKLQEAKKQLQEDLENGNKVWMENKKTGERMIVNRDDIAILKALGWKRTTSR